MTLSSSKPLRNSWHLILTNKALSMSPALALTFAYPMLLSCIALSFSLQKSTYILTATLLLMLSPVSLPSESLKGHDRFYFLCKIFTIIQNSTTCRTLHWLWCFDREQRCLNFSSTHSLSLPRSLYSLRAGIMHQFCTTHEKHGKL